MKKKIMYLDVARIAATFAVIVIHIASSKPYWNNFGFDTFEWNIFNLFTSCSRWAVPVFCMISGALFLDPDRKVSIKKLYTKNVLRMIISFVFWSGFYLVAQYELNKDLTKAALIKKFVGGHYHMWFLFLIVGFYILVPILRKITADKNTAKYFVGVSMVFTFIIPFLLQHPKLDWAYKSVDKIFMFMPLGYTSFFIMGYLINKFGIKKWMKAIIYIAGPLSFLATTYITSSESIETGKYFGAIGNYNSITVLFESLFVITLVKDICSIIKFKPRSEKFIGALSKDTFGIYFLHPFAITTIDTVLGINPVTFNPVLSILLIMLITYIACELVSHILNKIPVIKNYLV